MENRGSGCIPCLFQYLIVTLLSLPLHARLLDEEPFPGWRGEQPRDEWRGEIVQLSWEPRAFLLKNFLSPDECDHLIEKARPLMHASRVIDNATGQQKASNIRTSTGTFLKHGLDDVVSRIERRVAQVTMIPTDHQESMQILHYVDGQKYEPHWDYFHDPVNVRPEKGGQRVATVLMYLTTVEEGGETVFPNAKQRVTGDEWSQCAKKGLAVKTRKGDALLFWSLHPDGQLDTSSLHGSCPTTKGEKWSATKWIHVMPFGQKHVGDSTSCADVNPNCASWAASGECSRNPSFMHMQCRKSCAMCSS